MSRESYSQQRARESRNQKDRGAEDYWNHQHAQAKRDREMRERSQRSWGGGGGQRSSGNYGGESSSGS